MWQAIKDPTGRTYYYNVETDASQWEKPSELWSDGDRVLHAAGWVEYSDAEGSPYWYQPSTKVSTRENPLQNIGGAIDIGDTQTRTSGKRMSEMGTANDHKRTRRDTSHSDKKSDKPTGKSSHIVQGNLLDPGSQSKPEHVTGLNLKNSPQTYLKQKPEQTEQISDSPEKNLDHNPEFNSWSQRERIQPETSHESQAVQPDVQSVSQHRNNNSSTVPSQNLPDHINQSLRQWQPQEESHGPFTDLLLATRGMSYNEALPILVRSPAWWTVPTARQRHAQFVEFQREVRIKELVEVLVASDGADVGSGPEDEVCEAYERFTAAKTSRSELRKRLMSVVDNATDFRVPWARLGTEQLYARYPEVFQAAAAHLRARATANDQ